MTRYAFEKKCRMAVIGFVIAAFTATAGIIPEINIIPSPKTLKTGNGAMPLNEAIIVLDDGPTLKARTAAEEINKAVRKLSAAALPVKTTSELTADDMRRPLVLLGMPATHKMLQQCLVRAGLTPPLKPGGYLAAAMPGADNAAETYLLAGHDEDGVLHATASFKFLLRGAAGQLTALRAEISDWPDCAHRSLVLGSAVFENRRPAKKLAGNAYEILDWCFDHKFNFAGITSYRISNGNFTIPNPDITHKLRAFNEYAAARGMETCYHCFYTGIGYIPKDKGNPEFEGCQTSGGLYWCWSRDALIRRQVERIAGFLKEAAFQSVILHFRDGSPTEYWRDRCRQCRDRFGDDRAAATANYINIAYEAIRAQTPAVRLIFVVEPYYGNLAIPENRAYRDFFARLTTMIPEDVHLTNAGATRETQESWAEVIRQPVFQWRNLTMDFYRTGRMYTTEPALTVKSGFFDGGRNIPYLLSAQIMDNEPLAVILTAAEFMWNVDAPGAVMLRENTSAPAARRIEDLFGYPAADGYDAEWLWHKSSTEPAPVAFDLLPRICATLHGADAATMMAEIYRMGIADRVLLMTGKLYTSASYYNILRNPDVIRAQWQNAEKAVRMLEEFDAAGKKFKDGIGGRPDIHVRLRRAAIAGAAHYHILRAEMAAKAGDLTQAETALQAAETALHPHANDKNFAQLRKAFESAEMRLMIARMAGDKPEGVIKVGLYNPLEVGGNVMGFMPIYMTLMKEPDMHVTMLPTLETLDIYDCVIIPDCKQFGQQDRGTMLDVEKEIYKAEKAVRDYVMREGGGVVFYHDSVGYSRFPMGRGMFPELAGSARKIDAVRMTIKAAHPVTAGYKVGQTHEHMYSDHIAMQAGEWGKVLAVNDNGDAVVIAGAAGAGRVVLNGTYHANRAGVQPDILPAGIDRDLLLNTIRWLARKDATPPE